MMKESMGSTAEGQPAKKSKKKWWVMGILAFLFLCLVATAIVGVGIYMGARSVYSTMSAPVGPIKDQLEAINEGGYKAAYAFCSNAFQDETSYQDFVQIIESNPQIFKSKKSSFTQVNIKNEVATVSGTITGKDGTVTPMVYQLVKEKGKWRILNFKESAAEEGAEEETDTRGPQ